ncbi:MAG: Hsp20/alpha crystallin family protein [Bacteroidetes bacterium]|nr:Hsp20/alpha crystallin family protein [Bacteroidota bacterium]
MLPVIRRGIAMPNILDDFFGRDLLNSVFDDHTGISVPAVNVIENNDEFKIEVAAPGLDKNDFKIDLENNVLTISSERELKNEESDKNGKFMRREFSYSSFKRSFTMPQSIEADKISAKHKDGVLYISIPKKEEAKQKPPRQISIM